MVKNDGTANSKERRHNGNGWRGVDRLGRAGKRTAGRREGDLRREGVEDVECRAL